MPTPTFTFPQSRRLKTPAEFQRVYDRKKSASDSTLVVYGAESELPHPRVGLSVSKKVGNAVVRNRYKRLYREAFRLTQHELPNLDVILIPKLGREEPTLDEVKASLLKLSRQVAARLAPRANP